MDTLQFLSTWLYMLATDLSMSARFRMFFRIPLSSFLAQSVRDDSGEGGCIRCETGRSEDTGGRDVGTNWTSGRSSLLLGESKGGSGGGGGGEGEPWLFKGGGGSGMYSGLLRQQDINGVDGGQERGDVLGEGGGGCSGGRGGGSSGGSGITSTVI